MIRRSYHCDVCEHDFEHVCEKNDPDPDCPECAFLATRDLLAEQAKDAARLQTIIDSGKAPAVIGHKAKAIDFAQKMSEDMGYTNMRDNTRPGEANFMPDTPMTTAQATEVAREMMQVVAATPALQAASPHIAAIAGTHDPVSAFWGGSGSVQGAPGPASGLASNVQAGAHGAVAARSEGHDPVAMLHDAGRKGKLPIQHDVVGKAPMPVGAGI